MRKTNGKRDCVTILTQYFRPEVAATAQMSSDLADGLSKEGWDVIVLTGQPSYLGSEEKLPGRELSNGIEIRRFFNPGWRKSRVTGRFMNAFIVSVLMMLYLLFDRRHRLLLVDTTSPFFPLVARIISIIKRWRYIYWIQDVYPDIAVELGYLRRGGVVERVWNRLNVWCAVSASSVVTIGPKMKEIVQAKLPHEAAKNRLTVIHNWADGDSIAPLPKEENWFCRKFDLVDKFTVLYSGNMGASHDLESVVLAARQLKNIPDIRFVLIGGGIKVQKITDMVNEYELSNVMILPYQSRDALPYSLTCGDISIVTLEPGIEGLSVPSKLYSSLAAGQAILAIMYEDSDVSEIVESRECGWRISPGNVSDIVGAIKKLYENPRLLQSMKDRARACFESEYTRVRGVSQHAQLIKSAQNH